MLSRRLLLAAVSAVTLAAGAATSVNAASAAPPSGNWLAHPEKLEASSSRVEMPSRGAHAAKPGGGGGSASMLYHSGAVMDSAVVQPIFWGTKWADGTNPAGSTSFTGDKLDGLRTFYTDYSGSHYAGTVTEYTGLTLDGSGSTKVGTTVTTGASLFDPSATPSGAPSTSQVLQVVANQVALGHLSVVRDGYYPVYSDQPRGNAGYCAWHSYGTIGGTPVQIAFFFNLDGDPGCDPRDSSITHSQGLEALANVSAHELAEAMSDPRNGGWYDRQGSENADKCAWTFHVLTVTLSGSGSSWKLQGEWSNDAYTSGTGYPNNSGQKGCLDGH